MVVITVNEYSSAVGKVHEFELVLFEPTHPSWNAKTIFCWYSNIRRSTLIKEEKPNKTQN